MNLCIVGCGNMGLIYAQFLLEGKWVEKENLLLIEKNEDRRNELQLKNIGIVETPGCKLLGESDLILLVISSSIFNDSSLFCIKSLEVPLKDTFHTVNILGTKINPLLSAIFLQKNASAAAPKFVSKPPNSKKISLFMHSHKKFQIK